MGNIAIEKCIFSGKPVKPIIDRRDCIDYSVEINMKNVHICLPHEAFDWSETSHFFQENLYKFKGLLFNEEWFEDQNQIITQDSLEALLARRKTNFTTEELLNRIFKRLFNWQVEVGQSYLLSETEFTRSITVKNYFKSNEEALFFVKELHFRKLIEILTLTSPSKLSPFEFRVQITFKGLTYFNQITNDGEQSKKCFIAMAFREETKIIREKIKEALIETGYEPIIIDEQHTSSDQTINDAIIAALRSSKFCVSDFSFHSNGVYFESGFALGQGKQVIYTCSKEEFEKAHFDIRPLQHIIYENPEELKKALVNKIEAWIK